MRKNNLARSIPTHSATQQAFGIDRNLYQAWFRCNPQPMWIFDTTTWKSLAVNAAACRQYGFTEGDLLQLSLGDLRTPAEVQSIQTAVTRLSDDSADSAGRWTHLRRDGQSIHVDVSFIKTRYNGVPSVLVMTNDVSEVVRSTKNLLTTESKYRAFVEQSYVGVFIIDIMNIVYANPRAEQIFGYGLRELEGQPFIRLIAPHDLAVVLKEIDNVVSRRVEFGNAEFTAIRKDGSTVLVGAQGRLANDDGRPLVMGVLQDITEKRRLEASEQSYREKLERSIRGTADAVGRVVELRDPYTAGHERRVGEIAAAIAEHLGWDGHRRDGLQIAGSLHDVGKITVPAEILTKPGRLTSVEFELIKTHAQQGYEVLKDVDFPWPIAEVARQHHERMNGSGYPRGLKGEEIIPEARILAVADVIESMASHRPYRPSLGIEIALQEIERNAGALYDEEAAEACLYIFRRNGFSLPQ